MLCSNCKEYKVLLALEEYIVSLNPTAYSILHDLYENYFEICTNRELCPGCGCGLVEGECYLEESDGLIDDVFRFIGEEISKEIDCCTQCGEGEEIQALYPSIKSCFYDEDDDPEAIFEGIDTSSTVEDIMNDFFEDRAQLWYDYYDRIVEFISCPKCGNGSGQDYDEKIDNGSFDLYTDVYTKNDIQRFNHDFYGDEIETLKSEISELAKKCSLLELINLKNQYIHGKDSLTQNQVCKKLVQFIRAQYQKRNWYELSENRMLFRARTERRGMELTKDQMWEPPVGCAGHGRYNDIGVSLLYCSNNRDVVKKEVDLPAGCSYNIAKFITRKSMRLFPINNVFGGEFSGLIDERVPEDQQNEKFKTQYIISNIVSAICNANGYDGIVYRSTKDADSIDYALFCKYERGRDIEVLDVEYMS